MGIGFVSLGLVLLAGAGQAKDGPSFIRDLAGAEIDWSAGAITARAGSAADIRMPGPNAARPGAERRARAAAEVKLRAALRTLAHGRTLDVDAAVKRASVVRSEYQSDGGVFLWLGLRFTEVVEGGKNAAKALKTASMPFAFAPTLTGAGKEAQVSFAIYRPMSECPKDALPVERDSRGRLEITGADANLVDSFAGAAVVIYLEQAQP